MPIRNGKIIRLKKMINTIFILILCHLIGDYVLQCDFIAKTKGSNTYHMFVHCMLYSLPFIICFGLDWRIYFIILIHLFIDQLKAKYNKINYFVDQLLHYITLLIFLV